MQTWWERVERCWWWGLIFNSYLYRCFQSRDRWKWSIQLHDVSISSSLPLCINMSLLFIPNFSYLPPCMECFLLECPMCGFKEKHMEYFFVCFATSVVLFLLLFMCLECRRFISISTMNINAVTVISGGGMDVIILYKWAFFFLVKCFISELHIMKQKPVRPQLKNTTPSLDTGGGEGKEYNMKHLERAWSTAVESLSPWWLFYMLNLALSR